MGKKMGLSLLILLSLSSLVACSSTDSNTEASSSSKGAKSTQSSTNESSDSESSSLLQMAVNTVQPQISKLKEQYNDIYSEIQITTENPETLILTYAFTEDQSQKIDVNSLKAKAITQLAPIINNSEINIPNLKVRLIYLSPDKKELANILVTQKDIEQIEGSQSSSDVDYSSLQGIAKTIQSQVPSRHEELTKKGYSELKITAEDPKTLIYTYTFSKARQKELDNGSPKPTSEELIELFKAPMTFFENYIPGIRIRVVFLTPDKKELISQLITQKDIE